MIEIHDDMAIEPIQVLDNLLNDLKEFSPVVRRQTDEGYDWLEADEEWCACVVIPNLVCNAAPIEIELAGEFTLYFRWSHIHYFAEGYEYPALIDDVKAIMSGRLIVNKQEYNGNPYSWGFRDSKIMANREACREAILKDVELLPDYDWSLRPDGIFRVQLGGLNPSNDVTYEFRLDELADVPALIARQNENRKNW